MRNVELLSPAKNAYCGIEAVKHGADAVYIGAPRFSARAAAGNSWEDIEKLLNFAHVYRAKVFVALNTILGDAELEEAASMAVRCYEMGVDALIVQDMGLLRMDLPPIALHASTQCDNRSVEKVKFLQKSGFQRVVLARELSLKQISDIHRQCEVELEAFVHGSLCVSYSGLCYMSYASCGRSANRGNCAQYCRLPYDLEDANGKKIAESAYLLSLKDMDRSDSLESMLDAGVTSLKIEGRLKDADYVKNITLYYRRRLDAVLEGRSADYVKASMGRVYADFIPDPKKTFHRDATPYFLSGKRDDMAYMCTSKSMGEEIGTVREVAAGCLKIRTEKDIHNGDGLCFLDGKQRLQGFRINSVRGDTLFPLEMPESLTVGTRLFRNEDRLFSKKLQGETAQRRIPLRMCLTETETAYCLTLTSEDGVSVRVERPSADRQYADKADESRRNIIAQLSRLGGTEFETEEVSVEFPRMRFIPASFLASMRREAVEALSDRRSVYRPADAVRVEDTSYPWPFGKKSDYRANVRNRLALSFYTDHGVEEVEPALEEGREPASPLVLMQCRYCIRYALGACRKQTASRTPDWKEPLSLVHGKTRYRLEFDCSACEMKIQFEP